MAARSASNADASASSRPARQYRDCAARAVEAAAAASTALAAQSRYWRAGLLEALASALEAERAAIVAIAEAETGYSPDKLNAELTRTTFQLTFFAGVLREGSYLEATIDPAADTPMGPRPDLRRILVPIGPVAVFGASNFPLAFSVPGGDTASALAAGCAVVAKAHSSHPGTSMLCYEVMDLAATGYGAPVGTISLMFGTDSGRHLVTHPLVKAVGFTGSLGGGKALMELISQRPEPIPFYGELSSINPVVVTPRAADERAEEIGAALVTSFTTGSGQLCTKPGIVLVPSGEAGDRLVRSARESVSSSNASVLLNARICADYEKATQKLAADPRVQQTVADAEQAHQGYFVLPRLFETEIADFTSEMAQEIFGPTCLVVRYEPGSLPDAVDRALGSLSSSLTATLHTSPNDEVSQIISAVSRYTGRIVFNGYPTGVAVSWAQNHGGPWPSTNSLHTSVGATAIRRFLRPLTFQNSPQEFLPEELRDVHDTIPRRINGDLQLPE